eukprot:scaffold170903_cov19-Prasinocladus_malaysianus.AAC.1
MLAPNTTRAESAMLAEFSMHTPSAYSALPITSLYAITISDKRRRNGGPLLLYYSTRCKEVATMQWVDGPPHRPMHA